MLIKNITDKIGNTPLISLNKMGSSKLFAKAEFLNPGGSIKDRVALNIVEQAEKRGELKKGMTIIEATSGNTGIGLSLVGLQKGYKVICVMPANMSEERVKIIRAFGGTIFETDPEKSLDGSLEKVQEIMSKNRSHYFHANQFANKDNSDAHYFGTAQEIWEDLDGKVDVFVAGVGSGGTLQGIGKFLKEKNPNVKIVAVEPKNSAALLGREPGLHQIQGIGDGFIPELLDTSLIDMVFTVSDEEAISVTRELAVKQGLLVGTSSGANVFAALHVDNGHNNIVTVLPDRAERYFSTSLL